MDLRQLRYFLAVAETLNFSQAARKLGMAQPPLSTQIKQLENYFGQTLFQRTSRKVELTDAGRALSEEASRLMRQVESLEARMKDLQDGRDAAVCLVIEKGLASPTLARKLRKYTRRHRGVRLQVVYQDGAAERVASGLADAGIVVAETPNPGDVVIGTSRMGLITGRKHRLADRETLDFHDVVGEHLLLSPPGHRGAVEQILLDRDASILQRNSHETISGTTLERCWLAESGAGVAITHEWESDCLRFQSVFFSGEQAAMNVLFMTQSGVISESVAAIRDFLVESEASGVV